MKIKKFFIILFGLLVIGKGFCGSILKERITLDLFASGGYEFEGINAGAKLTSPFFEVVLYGLNENWTYGLSFFSEKINPKFPVIYKFGKLSFSGSLGKMNSPLLTASAGAFSNSWTTVNCITASLPGTSSFSKDMASFVQVGFKDDQIIKNLKVNFFYDFDTGKNAGISMYGSFQLNEKIKLDASYTAGFFPYEEKKISSWFNQEKYYAAGEHFCSNFQIAAVLKKSAFLFMGGCYETPFGGVAHIYRLENQLKGKNLTFNFSSAINLNDKLITSSDKKDSGCVQVKSSLSYKFSKQLIVPVMLKFGGGMYGGISLTGEPADLKLSFGGQAVCMYCGIGLYVNCNGEISGTDFGHVNFLLKSSSVQLKNSIYLEFMTVALNGSFSLTPDSKYETWTTVEKIGLNVSFPGMPSVVQNNSVSFTQKNMELSRFVIDSGVTLKITLGKIYRLRGTFKISVQIKSSSLQE